MILVCPVHMEDSQSSYFIPSYPHCDGSHSRESHDGNTRTPNATTIPSRHMVTNIYIPANMEHECCYKRMLMNLNDLRQNSQHCDVQLQSSDGVLFMAHSIIVCAWSKALHHRLRLPDVPLPAQQKEDVFHLHIHELTGDVLSLIVEFMYGNVASDPQGIDKLLYGLKTLEISVDEGIFQSNKDPSPSGEGLLEPYSKAKPEVQIVTEDCLAPEGGTGISHTRASPSETCILEDTTVSSEESLRLVKNVKSHKNRLKHREDKRRKSHLEVAEENDGDLENIIPSISPSDEGQNVSTNGNKGIEESQSSESISLPKVTKGGRTSKHFCTVCQRQFPTLASFEGHQNGHKNLKPYCCSKCPKSFAYSISLRRHEKKCIGLVGPKAWECSECKYSTTTMKDYKAHRQSHKKPLLQCSQCEKQFRDEKRLDSHIRSIHGLGHICSLCGKHIQSQSGYEQHMKTHEQKFPLHCHVCGKGFHNQQHFEGHVNKHQGDRPYMCTKCGQSFGYEQAVRCHERRCSEGKKTPANKKADPQCELCGLVFKNAHSLQGHKRGKHGSKSHQCSDCGQQFIWRQSFNRHRASCKGPAGLEEEAAKVHCCSQCAMRFKLKTSLKEHIRAKHEAPTFLCADCPARFNWKSSYYRHRRTSHSAADATNAKQLQTQESQGQEPNLSTLEQQEQVLGSGPHHIETNLQLIGEYQPEIEEQMIPTSTLLVEGDDITEVPLLDTVTEWQYTDTFTYQ